MGILKGEPYVGAIQHLKKTRADQDARQMSCISNQNPNDQMYYVFLFICCYNQS